MEMDPGQYAEKDRTRRWTANEDQPLRVFTSYRHHLTFCQEMTSDDIIGCLARDFAETLNPVLGSDDPPNEFFDPIIAAFGRSPTKEQVIDTYNSPDGTEILTKGLVDWCESGAISNDIVQAMLETAIVNIWGVEALPDHD